MVRKNSRQGKIGEHIQGLGKLLPLATKPSNAAHIFL
jgi:hypothetical protein